MGCGVLLLVGAGLVRTWANSGEGGGEVVEYLNDILASAATSCSLPFKTSALVLPLALLRARLVGLTMFAKLVHIVPAFML